MSRKQFFITMRDDFVPILMDRGSKNGTAVSYQGIGGEQFRSKDRWVLALPPSENDHDIEVIIHIRLCNYKLKIEFPNHASKDVEHLDKLERFVDNRRVIVPIIESLGLRNTAITTSASTLDEDEGPLYIRISEIGLGSSATVWKVFNSRDGGVFAAKVFKPPEQKRGAEISWKANIHNEVNIMKENVHVGIIH